MSTALDSNNTSNQSINQIRLYGARDLEQKLIKKRTFEILAAVLFALTLGGLTDAFIAAATLSYSFMIIGIRNVRHRELHWKFMGSTMLLDVLLVLVIEMNRHAIQTTLSFKLNIIQQSHIYVSTLAMLCYLPLIVLGRRHLTGKTDSRSAPWHRRLGILAFVLRTLSFILMFSMLEL